jgi:transposase-like protein
MKQLIDREVTVLAGKPHSQDTDNNRWCHQKGSVIIGGQRHPIVWQRVRTRDGKEVPVTSYKAFGRNDARTKAVYDRLVAGVSCRDYASTVEAITDGYGISRSVASREMIRATAKDLKALVERDLSELDIHVVLVDGIRLAERVMIVAVGVTSGGNKHVLGFREGATENSRVCIDLFQDLVRRGLGVDHPILFVIDGSTALRSAVDKFFGENAIVQRCQKHKSEDLKKYLPQNYHAEVGRKLQAAYAMTTYENAHQALRRLVGELGRINVSAANSLEEGLEETLTIHRLGLPDILRKSFSTTNLI